MPSGVLLSLAGFDPTSGAGVTLDLKVFTSHNFQGMGLVTAITVQNTQEVKDLHCLPAELVQRQYQALTEDTDILGIKVGMLGCREHISTIASVLETSASLPAVIDPVLRSSSGTWLLEPDAVNDYMGTLAGRITLGPADISGLPHPKLGQGGPSHRGRGRCSFRRLCISRL